jgi:hypothetical protein
MHRNDLLLIGTAVTFMAMMLGTADAVREHKSLFGPAEELCAPDRAVQIDGEMMCRVYVPLPTQNEGETA